MGKRSPFSSFILRISSTYPWIIYWKTRHDDAYPLLTREKHHQRLKELPENTLLCKNNKDSGKVWAARLQSPDSDHTLPTQAALTVNVRKFGWLFSDYDGMIMVLSTKREQKKSFENTEYNSNATEGALFQDFCYGHHTSPHITVLSTFPQATMLLQELQIHCLNSPGQERGCLQSFSPSLLL